MSENNPEVEKAAPVEVKASVPLQVEIIASSVEALGGTVAATHFSTPPAKDPLYVGPEETPVAAPRATAPTPVLIAAEQSPVPVIVEATAPPAVPLMPPTVNKREGVTLPPTTTEEQDTVTKGQRHINRVWEYSQAAIALLITLAIVYCAINKISSQDLTNSFFLIIGFYFSRANHQATGGVGAKPLEGAYTGR